MLSQGNDPVYMENYLGWAFEFLKNYTIWKESYQTAKDKLDSVRQQKQYAINTQKANLERIADYEGKIKYLTANPNASINASGAYSNPFLDKNSQEKQKEKKKTRRIIVLAVCIVIGINLLVFIGIGLLSALSTDADWKTILSYFAGLIVPFIPLAVIIGIAAIIFFAYKGKKHKPTSEDFATERRRQLGRYEDTVVELKNTNINCQKRYEQLTVVEPIAEKNLQDIKKYYKEAEDILKKHLSIDVVPEASREYLLDLEALRHLRYYLASGICNVVLGADGIYTRYHLDKQHWEEMNMLNRINNNQLTMIDELQSMHSAMDSIQSSLSNIEVSVADIQSTHHQIARDLSDIKTNQSISTAAQMQIAANTNYMRGVAYDEYMRRL